MKMILIFSIFLTVSMDISLSLVAQSPQFNWAGGVGGTSLFDYVIGESISIDHIGDVYITGRFSGTVDFDPGAGAFVITSNGDNDIFILKLDISGNFLWAKNIGGLDDDRGHSIVLDTAGNIYITGSFFGTIDTDPDVAVYNLTSNGNNDIFILKLDSDGNFVWAKSIGGSSSDVGLSLTIDNSDKIYLTGWFSDIVDFNPDSGVFYLTGSSDVFVTKFDTNGNFIWAKGMGGSYYDQGNSITVDDFGNVYTTGTFQLTADFDPDTSIFNLISNGSSDVFISKLDFMGNFLWAKSLGGNNYTNDEGNSLTVDNIGNVYITGSYSGMVDFDPGVDVYNLNSFNKDIYVLKLDTYGDFIWAKSMEGGNSDRGISIALDEDGSVYITGVFYGTVDFNPNIQTHYLTSNGETDIFLTRLDSHGNLVWAKNIGGSSYETSYCITIDTFRNIYMTGYFRDSADFNPSSENYYLYSNCDFSLFTLKFSQTPEAIADHINITQMQFQLYQNVPNPFKNETEFSFYLPKKLEVKFTILNLIGEVVEELLSGEIQAGKHILNYRTSNLAAGCYYYKLETSNFSKTKKMVIVE